MKREESRDVVPDFVNGFAFGDALGIGLRCMSTSSWTVTALSPSPESLQAVSRDAFVEPRGLFAYLGLGNYVFSPSRDSVCYGSDTRFARSDCAISGFQRGYALIRCACYFRCIITDSPSPSARLPARSLVHGRYHGHQSGLLFLRYSSYRFYRAPPKGFKCAASDTGSAHTCLACVVHSLVVTQQLICLLCRTDGAGVDIFKQTFWADAVPRHERSWVIIPEGRGPWVRYHISAMNFPSHNQSLQGLDWHGSSADDAWSTVSALDVILKTCSRRQTWAIAPEKVVIIGHSNGGQGTWHNAARHPDRVLARKKSLSASCSSAVM